jgi:hypothetical protein
LKLSLVRPRPPNSNSEAGLQDFKKQLGVSSSCSAFNVFERRLREHVLALLIYPISLIHGRMAGNTKKPRDDEVDEEEVFVDEKGQGAEVNKQLDSLTDMREAKETTVDLKSTQQLLYQLAQKEIEEANRKAEK